ncbi:MAG: hypothetical protein P4L50_19550 [Anaerolineaceae bacterium]|nr:hypothetical protein [Anaerolineaceae bacterium]
MKTISRVSIAIALGLMILSACNLPAQAGDTGVGPTAWIDTPLNQSMLPLAPVQIVAHGYDAGGVAKFEISVNGNLVNTLPPIDANGKLYMTQENWNPPGNGNFTLSVRAQNTAGAWGAPVSVVITIGNSTATPTPTATLSTNTPSPTPSPLASASSSPTLTTTVTATLRPLFTKTPIPSNTPVPTSNALQFQPSLSTNPIQYCAIQQHIQPDEVFSVKVTGPQQVASVNMYAEFHPKGGGSVIDLGNAVMNSEGSGVFSRSIIVSELKRATGVAAGEIHYWFVAYDATQNQTGKSQTYKDLKITVCP